MQTHTLIQGSPEWLAYRANHFNASDAPAMMGVSPYKSRTDLLHELHTGMAKEVDAATQARFDDGHRFEALARSRAEEIIGEDLFPVTGSEGRLSASFDGLTMLEDIVWEHKTLNDGLRAAIRQQGGNANEFLAPMYRIQMEQQLLVSGAGRALFLASRWEGDVMAEERYCWYTPDMQLRAEIIAGWEQLKKELDTYVPAAAVEKPSAEVIMALPALVVQTRGEVVESNLPQYEAAAMAYIENINSDLKSDEDFANAEADIKHCKKSADELEHAKAAVLAQASTIDEVMRVIDVIKGRFDSKRLMLTKLVATKKDQIKETILSVAKLAYVEHVAALEAEIKPLRLPAAMPDFAGAMKNKRTLASLNDAVNTLLASAKITTNATAADYRAKQAWCKENAAGHGHLFTETMAQIITKPMDDFQLVVTTRIEAHKQAEAKKEAELRARIAAEEQTKAEAAAKAKADAEERERHRAADAAQRLLNEQAAAALAEQNRLAAVAAEQQRASERAAANVAADAEPSSPARLQALADQNLADKRELAQVERITGVPMRTVPYAVAGAPLAALADDVVNAEYPSDSDIIDMMCEKFDMLPAEAIERLAVFDAAATRAALVAEAA